MQDISNTKYVLSQENASFGSVNNKIHTRLRVLAHLYNTNREWHRLYQYVHILMLQKIFLPHPVHAFGTRKCTDLNDVLFQNPLEFFEEYSLYACKRECRSKFTYQHK